MAILLYLCVTLLAFIVSVICALVGVRWPFLLVFAIPVGIAKIILFIKERKIVW